MANVPNSLYHCIWLYVPIVLVRKCSLEGFSQFGDLLEYRPRLLKAIGPDLADVILKMRKGKGPGREVDLPGIPYTHFRY